MPALILLVASPVMLLLALGVKLSSPGPVFYRQERVTWNGERFSMLKFRTMPVDAEAGTGPVWASPAQRRATPFGAFLRRFSLDELPQFINVLRGEMSIVGPRPERPEFVHRFKHEIPGYMQKHLVKAGITGWAQVNDSARQHRPAGTHPVRPLLHRELVAVVRPADHRAHHRARVQEPQRLLTASPMGSKRK